MYYFFTWFSFNKNVYLFLNCFNNFSRRIIDILTTFSRHEVNNLLLKLYLKCFMMTFLYKYEYYVLPFKKSVVFLLHFLIVLLLIDKCEKLRFIGGNSVVII